MVSTLGQSLSNISLLSELRGRFDTLNRQVATGKVADNFTELGSNTRPSLRFRDEINKLDRFINTIDNVNNRIEQMDDSIQEAARQTRELRRGLDLQVQEGEINIATVNSLGKNTLAFLQDLVNTQSGERFVFAGSAVGTEPFEGESTLLNNVRTELNQWLTDDDTDALLQRLDSLSNTELGYSPRLGTSGNIFARADNNLEIDYTVKADNEGFKQAILASAVLRELEQPQEGDFSTEDEFEDAQTAFFELVNEMGRRLSNASEDLDNEQFVVADAGTRLAAARERHVDEKNVLQQQISKIEDADLADVITRLQAVDTQLQASFRVTAIASDLSLINFL